MSNPEISVNNEELHIGEINERLYRISGAILRLVIGDYKANNQHNIAEEPAVYLASHRSMLDIPPVGLSLLDAGRPPARFVAKKELWNTHLPGLRWWLNKGGALPVTRNQPGKSRSELNHFVEVTARGEDLIIFGEGTRQQGSEIGSIKAGPLYLADKAKRPIVPVGIAGTRPFKYGAIQVVFGEAIEHEEVSALYRTRKNGGLEIIRKHLQTAFDAAEDYLKNT